MCNRCASSPVDDCQTWSHAGVLYLWDKRSSLWSQREVFFHTRSLWINKSESWTAGANFQKCSTDVHETLPWWGVLSIWEKWVIFWVVGYVSWNMLQNMSDSLQGFLLHVRRGLGASWHTSRPGSPSLSERPHTSITACLSAWNEYSSII